MLNNIAALFGTGAVAGDYESISTTTVGAGGVASVTFSSIPSTYSHLQIRYLGKTNRATYSSDTLFFRINSDSAANYAYHNLIGSGATVFANGSSAQTSIIAGTLETTAATTGAFGVGVIDILDYTSTSKNKTVKILSGEDNNSGTANQEGYITVSSGLWFKTPEAINSITFSPQNGTLFSQYSSFALYGIK